MNSDKLKNELQRGVGPKHFKLCKTKSNQNLDCINTVGC